MTDWNHDMPVTARADFGADDYAAALAASNAGNRPLSLHLRLPLCPTVDLRRRNGGGMDAFEVDLARLDREMVLVRRCLSSNRCLQALHWSGSAVPWMSLTHMNELIDRLAARFRFEDARDRDFSVELDPRATDVLTLRHLEALGFNHLTLIVRVPTSEGRASLQRLQARIEPLLDETIWLGWHSLDLALDLSASPGHRETAATLTTLLAMAPPWISLRGEPGRATPPPGLRKMADTRLAAAGYQALGGSRYARHGRALEDGLALARRERARDHLGLGAGAVSRLPDAEARNAVRPRDYAAALDAGRLATTSGQWHRA